MKKNLPIGYSTLEKIKIDNCVYIDKTHHISTLVNDGAYYFLSRPRRFGKSLLMDTLKQAFLGNESLFNGLYLEKNWDWSKQNPVIHIDFGGGVMQSRQDLEQKIHAILDTHYQMHGLTSVYPDVSNRFSDLIAKLYKKNQTRVVVLIDEYDKPILDNIDNTDTAIIIREGLKNLYSVIKSHESHLKFVFLTGVSKFNKVSLFSGLNNLEDISLTAQYADICGYTQAELNHNFTSHLDGVDKDKLKNWYNGYHFGGQDTQKVYNPFDILLFFKQGKQYKNYWFETGSPSFLLKLLQSRQYYLPQLENLTLTEDLLYSFDIERISIETLLFQTGYLTIKSIIHSPFSEQRSYQLTYPNFEVRTSLTTQLMDYFIVDQGIISNTRTRIEQALLNKDFEKLNVALISFFAGIPYQWYVNNIASYEGFYATIIYSLFNAIGIVTIPEDATNKGRIDLSLDVLSYRILMEFKTEENADANVAISQIKTKGYPEKYIAEAKPVYLIGICFDKNTRNISGFEWELWES